MRVCARECNGVIHTITSSLRVQLDYKIKWTNDTRIRIVIWSFESALTPDDACGGGGGSFDEGLGRRNLK